MAETHWTDGLWGREIRLRTDIANLKKLAQVATPGPWSPAPGNFIVADFGDDPESGKIVAEVPCQGANDNDVAFIAACNPQLILALIEKVRL